jgi:hypothetical protein
MLPSADIVETCISLYERYWSFRKNPDKDKFRDYLRNKDIPREIIRHELTPAEEYSLKKLKEFPPAWCHKASNIFYAQNQEMFGGKRILEIGSGRHIDRMLVELSQTYHGVDPHYKSLTLESIMDYINPPDSVLQFFGNIFKKIRDRMEIGLNDDYAYDFRDLVDSLDDKNEKNSSSGFVEYFDKSGKIRLLACDYRDLAMQYDIVINGGARLEKEDIQKLKRLLTKEGIFLFMAPPDMPVFGDALTTKFFNNQSEVWIELQGRKESSVYTAFIGSDN